MRVSADTAWLEKKYWNKFIAYEEAGNNDPGKHPMLAICTYPLHKYGASEIIDIECAHQYSLIQHKGELALIGGAEHERAEENLRESEGILGIASQITSDVVYERDMQTGNATFYGDIDAHLGYEPGEYPRTMEGWREHVHPEDLAWIENQSLDQLEPGVPHSIEYRMRKKDGTYMTWWDRIIVIRDEETGKPLKFIGAATDITERKQVEETVQELDERYRSLVELMPDAIVTTDIKGMIIEINSIVPRVTGYSKDEIVGRHFSELPFIRARDIPKYMKIFESLVRGKVPEPFEVAYNLKDGTCRSAKVHVSLLEVDGGKVGIQAVLTDTTEHERAEEALSESNEKYRRLFDSSPVGITTLNLKGIITSCNPAVYHIGGYSEDELVGKHFTEIAPLRVKDIPKFIRVFKSILRGKVPEPFVTAYKRRDGTTGWTELHASLIKAGVKKLGIQVIQREITERKQAEESWRILLQATSGRPLTQLQKRFIREGLRDLSESAGIRLIFNLCRYRPECDKNIKKYIKQFKTARALLAASDQELQQVGVCPRGLFTIKLFRELPAEVLKQKIMERSIYKSSREVFDYLYYSMRDLKNEVFKVLYLNNRSQIIDVVDLFEGTMDSIHVHPREIVESAIAHGAAGLIFVHNHPTGDPTPSKTDKQLTRDLVFVGMILQINVFDHIIIGENSYFSFADDGLIQKYEENFLNLKIRGVLASVPLYQHYDNLPRGLHLQRQVNTLANIISHLVRK